VAIPQTNNYEPYSSQQSSQTRPILIRCIPDMLGVINASFCGRW